MKQIRLNLAVLALVPLLRAAEPLDCVQELNRLHHVRLKDGYQMLYADPKLAAYLLSLQKGSCPTTVVPIYSQELTALVVNDVAVVSTALILEAESEQSLRATLARLRPAWYVRIGRLGECVLPPVHAACAAPTQGSFQDHKARVELDTRRYAEMTRPQLRQRYAMAKPPEE